jgi:hypothetical protein
MRLARTQLRHTSVILSSTAHFTQALYPNLEGQILDEKMTKSRVPRKDEWLTIRTA